MKQLRKPLRKPAAPIPFEACIRVRPDGFYWDSIEGREYGPFATFLEAMADRTQAAPSAGDEEPLEVAETLEEAESEVGISGWFDPETQELGEEERPRIEEH